MSKLLAVPTAYNIYRVQDEVLQTNQGLMATMPAAVVLETLVMQGLAKVIARIRPFDIDYEEGEGEENWEGLYEQGVEKPETEPETEEELPGPWYQGEDDDGA